GVPAKGAEPVYSLSREAGQDAGEYAITVSAQAASNPNYTATAESGTLTITPAAITIRAEDKTKVYDNDPATDPALTATVSGVPAKGDAPLYSLYRSNGENAGAYSISVSAKPVLNPNYTVTAESGILTITPAAITIKADDKAKVCDGDPSTDPALTATVTGLPAKGIAPAYSLSRTPGQRVGAYAISVIANASANPNYAVTAEGGTLTITEAPAVEYTIRFDPNGGDGEMDELPMIGGVDTALPSNAFTRAHFRFGGWNTEADGSGASYADGQTVKDLSDVSGTVTLYAQWSAEVEIFVVGSEKTARYNGTQQINAGYTVNCTVGGLQSALPEGITAETDVQAASGTNVGTYTGTVAVTLQGGAAGFAVRTASARAQLTLTITPAPVTVKAENTVKTVGNADPAFTATVAGLTEGESAELIAYTLEREAGEAAGTYVITPVGAAEQGNYTVSFLTGTLTINPTPVNPAPVNPAPVNPAPVNPAPVNPAPVNPAPVNPAPTDPAPTEAQPGTEGGGTERIETTDPPLASFTPETTPEPTPAPPPQPATEQTCALLNLLAAIGTAATAIGMCVSAVRGKASAKSGKAGFLGLIPAAASIVTFLLTEKLGGAMALADRWTVPMLALLLANGALAWFTRSKE
ncbi:MAG: InlB B-repeat-containing protein, partial [Oscillospiraceae bacterium]|nr:InlB B-repeat-containing protein [Oscillospiraceae bacterium]